MFASMNSDTTSTDSLTPDQTGKALSLTGRTILNLEARGIISPKLRVGRIIRFDLDEVKAQLAAATDDAVRMIREAYARNSKHNLP